MDQNTKYNQIRSHLEPRTYKLAPSSRGFTLIETVVAILILSISLGALFTLAAGGFFSVRYARNQIVADNMLQEALEYVRNSRDNAFQAGVSWTTWQEQALNVDTNGLPIGIGTTSGCFAAGGCTVDPYVTTFNVKQCSGTCANIYYSSTAQFFGYLDRFPYAVCPCEATPLRTSYVRTIRATRDASGNIITITATVTWLNGNATRTVSQSTMVSNWNV